MSDMDEFGPVQIMVVGFGNTDDLKGEVLEELHRLREKDIIRLIDLVAVAKEADGTIVALETSDLTAGQAMEFGAIVGALIGLGADGEEGAELGAIAGAEAAMESEGEFLGDEAMWSIADTIPNGTAAAIALIEHRWAIPLRDAVRRAGGVALADTWLHPEDLVAVGAIASEGGS
jgi:uncharacterized membrane protein